MTADTKPMSDVLLTSEQIAQINRPIAQSLLYDLNLLPEQLITLDHGPGHQHWNYMLSVLAHLEMLERELAAVREYARHKLGCAFNFPQGQFGGPPNCSCGFAALQPPEEKE